MQPTSSVTHVKGAQKQPPNSNNETTVVLAKGCYVKRHLIGCGSYGKVYLAKNETASTSKILLNNLSEKLELLPVPEKLNPGEDIKPHIDLRDIE